MHYSKTYPTLIITYYGGNDLCCQMCINTDQIVLKVTICDPKKICFGRFTEMVGNILLSR